MTTLDDELDRLGYRRMSTADGNAIARATRGADAAWSIYEVATCEDGTTATVHWRTNDDLDHGVPTAYADDTFTVSAMETQGTALDRALSIGCGGGSRYGVGQVVLVYVDGKLVEKE